MEEEGQKPPTLEFRSSRSPKHEIRYLQNVSTEEGTWEEKKATDYIP